MKEATETNEALVHDDDWCGFFTIYWNRNLKAFYTNFTCMNLPWVLLKDTIHTIAIIPYIIVKNSIININVFHNRW